MLALKLRPTWPKLQTGTEKVKGVRSHSPAASRTNVSISEAVKEGTDTIARFDGNLPLSREEGARRFQVYTLDSRAP